MEAVWLEGDVPYLTTEQMVEVDRAMIEDFDIDLTRMMENAGRNLAHLARERFLDGDPRGKSVLVLAGPGGNGGGVLVAARRLHGYGTVVGVVAVREPAQMSDECRADSMGEYDDGADLVAGCAVGSGHHHRESVRSSDPGDRHDDPGAPQRGPASTRRIGHSRGVVPRRYLGAA